LFLLVKGDALRTDERRSVENAVGDLPRFS
jgi:hypothetical protein